jgi:hypothetical protein
MNNLGYSQNSQSAKGQEDSIEFQKMLRTRAFELFKMCDIEEKGFINKKDIQRMREPTGVSPEVLEEVFESLDLDKNGFLTLEEFTIGFSSFLGLPIEQDAQSQDFDLEDTGERRRAHVYDEQEEENAFRVTMESLGASHLIDTLSFVHKNICL